MKKTYETPIVIVEKFEIEDKVTTTSELNVPFDDLL